MGSLPLPLRGILELISSLLPLVNPVYGYVWLPAVQCACQRKGTGASIMGTSGALC